jgi:L-alanine-DL-glutamate epimerase-like enolase superfamily enzyme
MAADESIHNLASARAVLHARAADFLVLKPMRPGSLRLATEIASEAREQGVEVFVTTVLEGAVGRSGALHLAAALDATRPHDHGPAHGLATGQLLRHDVATGPDLVSGHMVVPRKPGAGVTT